MNRFRQLVREAPEEVARYFITQPETVGDVVLLPDKPAPGREPKGRWLYVDDHGPLTTWWSRSAEALKLTRAEFLRGLAMYAAAWHQPEATDAHTAMMEYDPYKVDIRLRQLAGDDYFTFDGPPPAGKSRQLAAFARLLEHIGRQPGAPPHASYDRQNEVLARMTGKLQQVTPKTWLEYAQHKNGTKPIDMTPRNEARAEVLELFGQKDFTVPGEHRPDRHFLLDYLKRWHPGRPW